jgi:hypothetical protein
MVFNKKKVGEITPPPSTVVTPETTIELHYQIQFLQV